jgi:hypothetical protein
MFCSAAAGITGLDEQTITKVTKLNLADSALHAPAARLGEVEFLPARVTCGASLHYELT